MSSHHIVREGQEPALLILDASYLSCNPIPPLLEWSPTIIVTAAELPQIQAHQLKIDVVVGHPTELKAHEGILQHQEPVEKLNMKEGGDFLEIIFLFLKQHNHAALNILMPCQKAKQEELKRKLISDQFNLNLVLLDKEHKTALYKAGKMVKWYPKEETVWVQPGLDEVTISTNGFLKNSDEERLTGYTEFKTSGSGLVKITGNAPFWLTEKII